MAAPNRGPPASDDVRRPMFTFVGSANAPATVSGPARTEAWIRPPRPASRGPARPAGLASSARGPRLVGALSIRPELARERA